ncbi:MAG: hypothetical protein ACTSXC_05840 [Candidatus Freyarchaeota archaeon]
MTGWPWPLDAVQGWFEGLWNWISEAVNSAASWVLDNVFKPIVDWTTPIWDKLSEIAREGREITGELVKDLPWPWNRFIEFFLYPAALVYSLTKPMFSWIWDNVRPYLEPVWNAIQGAGKWIWDGLSNFVKDPVGALSDGWNWITSNVKTMFDGALGTVSEWISGALSGVASALGGALQQLVAWIWQGLQELWNVISGAINWFAKNVGGFFQGIFKGFYDQISEWFSPGSPEKEVLESAKKVVESLQLRLKRIMEESMKSPADITSLHRWAWTVAAEVAGIMLTLFGVATAVDASHPVKDWGAKEVIGNIIAWMGLDVILRAPLQIMHEEGVQEALHQFFRKEYRLALPDEGDLRTYYLRGYVTEEDVRDVLARFGYEDKWIDAEIKSWQIIPGVSDLITFVVREVISPEDFYGWAAKQGLSEYWAKNYWEAHWRLPSFENLREAWWRGIISEEEFRKYIVWHDYKPEPRPGISKSDLDIMNELSYELPGKLDLRWMWRWGKITEDEFKDLLAKTGIHPDYLDKVAEAYMANELLDERNRFATTLETLYAAKRITEEEFRRKLEEIGFSSNEIDLRVERAQYRMKATQVEEEAVEAGRGLTSEKRRLATILEKLAYSDVISLDDFKARLEELGFTEEEISLRIDIVNAQKKYLSSKVKAPEPKRLSLTDLRYAWEYGLITDEELRRGAELEGYTPEDIDLAVSVEQIKALRTEIESVVREAMYDYRDGWLTREEFISLMADLGLPERLQAYWLARADMLAEREAREEEYKIFLESYRLGIIDESTFRSELRRLGMREDKIERVIYLENLRKAGKAS